MPRWRFQGRDLLALAAIAIAVWFAIRGAEGLPFHQSGSVAPAEAADQVAAQITLDREELHALPRTAPISAAPSGPGSATGGGASKRDPGSGSGSNSKGVPKPPPPPGGTAPLLQATVPGVGTITVDDPGLPLPGDTPLPPLPDTGQLPTLP